MPVGVSARAVLDPAYDHYVIRFGLNGTWIRDVPASQAMLSAIERAKVLVPQPPAPMLGK